MTPERSAPYQNSSERATATLLRIAGIGKIEYLLNFLSENQKLPLDSKYRINFPDKELEYFVTKLSYPDKTYHDLGELLDVSSSTVRHGAQIAAFRILNYLDKNPQIKAIYNPPPQSD